MRLRTLRRSRGIDVATITRELRFSRNYWSAVENARTILAEDRLRALLDLFECSPDETRELLALRDAARERGWWQEEHVRDNLQRFYGLEQGASRIRVYEGVVISGLLQTPDYARALIAASPSNRPLDVDRSVQIRMRRQERLGDRVGEVDLTVVMTEGVLRQYVAVDPAVQADQLRHLLDLMGANATSLDVRLAPFTRPLGGLIGTATTYLLDFDSPHLSTIAWLEGTEFGLTEDEDTVQYLNLSFQEALDAALSREESADLIEACLRDIEPRPGRPRR